MENPGKGPQENFAFNDQGSPHSATVMKLVKEKAEEQEGRRLLTADELRQYPLPPFDGVSRVDIPDITDPKHDTIRNLRSNHLMDIFSLWTDKSLY